MKRNKEKTIPAWHRFLVYAINSNGHVSQAEVIKRGYAKDKKALSNILYTLTNDKRLITYVKMFDHELKTWLYDIFLTEDGDKFMENREEVECNGCNEWPKQCDDIVITYNGNVVHSFKKEEFVKLLDLLDDVMTDCAIAGIL